MSAFDSGRSLNGRLLPAEDGQLREENKKLRAWQRWFFCVFNFSLVGCRGLLCGFSRSRAISFLFFPRNAGASAMSQNDFGSKPHSLKQPIKFEPQMPADVLCTQPPHPTHLRPSPRTRRRVLTLHAVKPSAGAMSNDAPPLPAALVCRGHRRCLCRARPRLPATRLRLFRGRARTPISGQVAHQGRGAPDRGEYREVAGAVAEGNVMPLTAAG